MSEMKMDAFRRSLKTEAPERCYILYGQERYLREHCLKELRTAVLGAEDDPFNLRRYEGKDLDISELTEAVESYPSFAERSMVEVWDFDIFQCAEDRAKQLIALLKDLPDYCCLAFVYDTIEYKQDKREKSLCEAVRSAAVSVEFPVQGQSELVRWVMRHFKAMHKEIDREDAAYLIFLCGSMMEGLLNEIGKIAVYASGERISKADIDAVAVPVVEAEAFKLADALSGKRYNEAAELMHKLFQLNTEPIVINAMIGSQLRRLYAALLVKQQSGGVQELMEVLGTGSEYMCRQYLRICSGFSREWYRNGIRRSAETDYRLKSGGGEPADLLRSMFLFLAASEA